MAKSGKCDNPMCTCDPCTCEQCACGATRLGDLERRVMEILWEQGGSELTARNVADVLPDHAYTTVATVLDRLVHKGIVHRRMVNRSVRFAPLGTQGAYAAVLMREALSEGRDPATTLRHFAEILSSREIAVLRAALESLGDSELSRQ
jgi:predicted transcriptional regulator